MPSVEPTDVLIWWLSQSDVLFMERWPLPERLAGQLRSCSGRNGRGRLWIDPGLKLGTVEVTGWPGTPLARHCEERAGVVILRSELPLLAQLPGLVTDLKLQRV